MSAQAGSPSSHVTHIAQPDGGYPVVTLCGIPISEMPHGHGAVTTAMPTRITCDVCRVSEEGPGD